MLDVFASRWYIVLITAAVAAAVAWWIHQEVPQRYEAEALLRLQPVDREDPEYPYEIEFADRVMNSHATLAESGWMQGLLVASLGAPDAVRGAAPEYDVRADVPANTDLMRLTVRHVDPALAARAANEAARLIAELSASPPAGGGPDAPPAPREVLVLTVFDEAAVPEEPTSLGLAATMLLGGLLGLVGGLGLAALAAGQAGRHKGVDEDAEPMPVARRAPRY